MYAVLWRALPGPRWLKVVQAVALALAVVAFCFLWLFPRISPLMPWGDNTVDNGAQSPSSTAPIHPGGPL